MSNKGNKRGYLTGVCFFAVAGAVMALVAVGALGGCGGGNTGVIPFAGVWVANSGTPRAQHYAGIDFRVAGTFNVPAAAAAHYRVCVSTGYVFRCGQQSVVG